MRPTAARRAVPPPADTFSERACQLVAFLVERSCEADSPARRREEELAEWIWRWQQASPSTQHFMGVELGIIVRALHGPSPLVRGEGGDCRHLCHVVAHCIGQEASARHES